MAQHETVTIGTQVWMLKNLDVSTYRNGDTIRYASSTVDWVDACNKKEGAWCYYDNDSSGFSGLPGGLRNSSIFNGKSRDGNWWSSSEYNVIYAWHRSLGFANSYIARGSNFKEWGRSVRCLRD